IFIIAAGEEIMKNTGQESDGFVEKCATHFGHIIRDDYALNHLDEINNMLGMRKAAATNPLSIYRMHANILKQLGL
ncbi:MAG: lipase, partial [Pseudomonadales bacterium]|nr:lipase [Pseudomonadales bacterium]